MVRNLIISILFLIPFVGNCQGNFFFNQHRSLTALVDTSTYINLIFDSSGSMNGTLYPLQEMVSNYLQDSLIGYYNNDIDIYNRKVSITTFGYERTFSGGMLNYNIDLIKGDPINKVVNIVYQDEADTVYYVSVFDSTVTLSSTYSTDISNLRDSVNQYDGTLKYTGIIFQVDFNDNYFNRFLKSVENGYENYSGANGLSDKSDQFVYYFNITDGGTAVYYTNLLMAALRDLGFDL